MAIGTTVSVEEYLRTSYRPDCDYVDGEVRVRNLGEKDHSGTQGRIIFFLYSRYPLLRDRVFPEQRVQVKAGRVTAASTDEVTDGTLRAGEIEMPLAEVLAPLA